MNFKIELHRDVMKYLDALSRCDKQLSVDKFKLLMENPFKARAGCDIKKLVSRKSEYRLRVGKHRFFYTIRNRTVLIEEAIRKKREY